ncbi:pentatricopeptide repeat-containing protein At3g12770-like [Cynara cardunculus var. scolymus]|uniref:pentatricopeptide repeat-containing protein At3g12770-like n=1 Tax=Cynara cardunculus var. scolymus TaxID=59895 RepID=UPI000D62D896|nr:pentatricopeptide repeat-containing protein At3g12770-like [Cynara cardunculus var. scolymus]
MFSTKPSQSPAPRHLLQLLQLSISNQSLKLTHQSHARVCHLGLQQHPVVLTNLINAYALTENTVQSRKLFDSIEVKDVGLWNTYINGFVKNDLHPESFSIFNNMCRTANSLPDGFTFSTLAKASGVIGDLLAGKCVHGKTIKLGFLSDTILTNSLMSMYNKCDRIQDSRKLFDEMPQRTISSWNIILSGYVSGENPFLEYQVWKILKYMLTEGLKPNEFTLSSLLPMCGFRLGRFDHGRELHCYIIRNELNLDIYSGVHLNCSLIDMYSRCRKVSLARLIFDQMRFKNVFTWTAMMNGYLQIGDGNEVVLLFCEMQRRGDVEPNEVSLLTLLPAGNLVAGLLGVMQIHGYCAKKSFINHTSFCNCLIDMYSKNGLLSHAREVFDHDCLAKDAISWGSMISGYGLHGKGQEAVDLYDKMLANGIKSDAIHVVGVLSACSRSGLVEKGLDVYRKATSISGFEPTMEMYSCVVDILGRSGQLDEALSFIKTLPLEPGPSVWGAFVSASVLHTNYETGVLAYKALIQIEPENPSNYVSLSNLHATSRKWDSVAEVRRTMKERSLRKFPGCSWITINSETHSFSASDKGHPDSGKIYEILNELILAMKKP